MDKKSFAAEFYRAAVIFLYGGFCYGAIEILFRGNTHPSMFVLGGVCFLWVGGINSFFSRRPPLLAQMLIGGLFITAAEFICGLVFNVWFGLRVWDYSKLPFNVMGQICPLFFFAWVLLCLPAIVLEDKLRAKLE